MQIVIELSDLDYKWITLRKGDETLYPLTLTVYEAIKNGKPLKTGHWIDIDSKSFEFHIVYKCSECGSTEIEYPEGIHRHFRYCPNCGAKMEEQDADSD